MKKTFLLFVFAFISFFIVSCNNNNDNTKKDDDVIEQKDDEKPSKINYSIFGILENMYVGDECKFTLTGTTETSLIYEIDCDVITISNLTIYAIKEGTARVKISCNNSDDVYTFTINVSKKEEPLQLVKSIVFKDDFLDLEYGDTYQIEYTVNPNELNPEIEFVLSNEGIISIDENNLLTAVGVGETILTIKALDGSNVKSQMSIIVEDTTAPVVTFTEEQNIKLPIGTTDFDFTSDIKVIDNVDGDITSRVKVNLKELNPEIYGTYKVTYTVSDSSNNTLKFIRNVEVVWPYKTILIGHGGGYFGIMNTMEAIKYSVEVLHYPMIEVDLCQTSDGVFVLCHDATFGDYTISKTPWSTFENYYITKSRNSGLPASSGLVKNSPYTSRICTLEEALDYCHEHNIILKIELKESKGINGGTTSGMARLMEVIKEHNMLELTSFTCFPYMKNNLIWLRENGYNNIIQYLCGTCEKQETLDLCLEYNFICSINPIYGGYSNSDEWIQKYKDAGVKLSAYTFDQNTSYATVQYWIDKGIDYITTDWHDPKKLNMPLN